MREATLDLDGTTLSYEECSGAGPAIVGLHGLGSSRAADDASGYFDWSALTTSGRRLVRYDARGHGRSTGRPVPAEYAWPHLADDLLALLDAISPNEPVDAFGASMGVGTLLHAVIKRPDRFRRLALIIPPTAWESRAAQSANYQQIAALLREHGIAALTAATASRPPLPILEAGGWTITPPDIDGSIMADVMLGASDTDLPAAEAIKTIQQPVLLRPWTDDPAHPLATSERLHELLPNAVIEIQRTPDDLRALGTRLATYFD
ncbi:Putative uncharacterized protein [Propionibacterium freudenreichii subsp. freudenreichii]|nr:Putative uncharacterized protein [Propionibacterium freudenreichii subsp. freudenreichii]